MVSTSSALRLKYEAIDTTRSLELLRSGKLTGLSKAGQVLADSLGVHGGHADGVFGVRGQLGEQDGCFLPTDLGLIGTEFQSFALCDATEVKPLKVCTHSDVLLDETFSLFFFTVY